VSRHDHEWLDDIIGAIQAIRDYQERGSLSDGLIFDAIRLRLIEIGEAVKRLSPTLLASEPDLPWEAIAGKPWVGVEALRAEQCSERVEGGNNMHVEVGATPPVTPGAAASTMVMVIPSVNGVRDGTAVRDRSGGRSGLF
jgi:hypothetical protein